MEQFFKLQYFLKLNTSLKNRRKKPPKYELWHLTFLFVTFFMSHIYIPGFEHPDWLVTLSCLLLSGTQLRYFQARWKRTQCICYFKYFMQFLNDLGKLFFATKMVDLRKRLSDKRQGRNLQFINIFIPKLILWTTYKN